VALVACGVLAAVTSLSAQQPPASAPPPGGPVQPAPVMRFDKPVGLEEAVVLTLQHDPALQQQQAAVDFQRGVVQQEAGAFDSTILASLFTEYRLQELTQSRKDSELEKRQTLEQSIAGQENDVQRSREIRDSLAAIQAAPVGSAAQLAELRRLSPSLAAQVETFDALIVGETDATTRQQLVDQRNAFITDQLNRVQGTLSEGQRLLADNVVRRERLGDPPVDEFFYRTNVNVSFQKLFRSGVGIAPFFEGSMEGTNFKGKGGAAEDGGKGLKDLYTLKAGVGLAVPLLRGRGATATASRERAATIEQEAAELDLSHQRSVSALRTIGAYWALVAAQESVKVAEASLKLQTSIAELTDGLIKVGDMPGIELSRAQAGVARANAQVQDAQKRVRTARIELATAMGLATSGDEATLPTAADGFPAFDAAPSAATLDGLPIDARGDVVAADRRQAAGQVLVEGAGTELRSKLDLSGRAYYTALDESTLNNTIDRWVGPSVDFTAEYEKPLGNNRAKGALAQAEADLRGRRIAYGDLRRQARLRAQANMQSLPDAAALVRLSRQAKELYDKAYQSELERLKAGESTLIDTLLTEQQYTESNLSLVAAQQELAQLIAQLRFESGTLLEGGRPTLQTLTTPPAGGGR
jgi:outer membrane protein TolC